MSTKQNNIDALRDSVTKSLIEIVSLKQTVKLRDNSIVDLNNKKSELTMENEKARVEMNDLKVKASNQTGLIKKLEEEKGDLKTAMKKLESSRKELKKVSKQN